MKPIYNLEDISRFLANQDYGVWSGQIFDRKIASSRPATIEDVCDLKIHSFQMGFGSNAEWKAFTFSEFNFGEVSYDNLNTATNQTHRISRNKSFDWCVYLLEEYGASYAHHLINWIDANLEDIENQKQTASEGKLTNLEYVTHYFLKLKEKAEAVIAEASTSVD